MTGWTLQLFLGRCIPVVSFLPSDLSRLQALVVPTQVLRSSYLKWSLSRRLMVPMLRKPPAEKGRIQVVLASREWTESRERAANAPSIPTLAVQIWAFPASHLNSQPPILLVLTSIQCHLEKPLFSNIAKSPTSCGISCINMAKVVMRPILKDARKLKSVW